MKDSSVTCSNDRIDRHLMIANDALFLRCPKRSRYYRDFIDEDYNRAAYIFSVLEEEDTEECSSIARFLRDRELDMQGTDRRFVR